MSDVDDPLPAISAVSQYIEQAWDELKNGQLEDIIPFFRRCFTSLQVPPPFSDPTQSLVVLYIVRVLAYIGTSHTMYEDMANNLRDLWPKIWPWISYLVEAFQHPVELGTGSIDPSSVMRAITTAIFAFSNHDGFRRDMLDTPGFLWTIMDNWVKKTPSFEGLFCSILADDSRNGDYPRKYLPPLLDGRITQVAHAAVDHLHRSIAHKPTNFEPIEADICNIKHILDLRIPDVFHALLNHDFIPLTIGVLSLFSPSDIDRPGAVGCLVGCLNLFRSILFSEHAVEWLEEALPQNLLRSIMHLGPCITLLPEGWAAVEDILVSISGCSVYLSIVGLLEVFIEEVYENEMGIMHIESLHGPMQMLKLATRERSQNFNDYIDGTLSRKFVKEGCITCNDLDAKWQCSGCRKEYCYVRYCSRECQKHDWPRHRIVCKSKLNLEKSGTRPAALSRSDRGFIWYIAQMDFLENIGYLVSNFQDRDPHARRRPVRIGLEYDTDHTFNILETHEHCIRCQDEPHLIILQVKIFGGARPSFIYGSLPLPESFQRRQPRRGLTSAKFLCTRHRNADPHRV